MQCYWTLGIWTLFFLIFKILFTFYQRDTNLDVGFTSRNGRLAWKIKLTKKRSVNSCYSNRQYKITSLTWFGTEILSLCGLFSQLTEQILFTRPSYQFITSCCLLWPVQILEETHPSVHAPFVVHDPDTVGTFPVPPDPTGKISTSLFLISFFEQFAAPMRRFTQVHCGQTSLNSHLISFMIEWTHQERECSLWDSNFYLLLSTAAVVLPEAPTPEEQGSSHGQTSFSGYLPPHVDSQHHSSPDIYTHPRITASTIFTPGRSWRYPYPSGSGLSTVTQGESHLECLFVNEVMDLDSESLS